MNDSQEIQNETEPDLLDRVSEEFLACWRRGEEPDINAFAARYPEHSEEIRELLEAVVFAEQLNPTASSSLTRIPAEPPTEVGPFTLHREIGRGGMGIVYEATQTPFTQKFAVKVLQPRLISSKTLSNRFAREAQAASRLHHPNIVPARHFGTEADQNYIVMPLIDGTSLDRLISNTADVAPNMQALFGELRNDYRRIAQLGAQIASALTHAHSNGMIHRDIKPANLLLDRRANVWITDFGLAKLYDDESDLSRTGELIGTPRYMAPEQLIGSADERSDIYGVGLTLYELITRRCPWGEKGKDSAKNRKLLSIPEIRELEPSVPKDLAQVIMKACAYHPESRYQTAREFELELNELCYQGKSDRRVSARSYAKMSNHQARSVAVLLGVLAIIATLSLLTRSPQSDSNRKAIPAADLVQKPSHSDYIFPESNCLIYEESGTGSFNAVITVNDRADDAEEYGEGTMYLDSTDLELTWDGEPQIVGIRFPGVKIPKGSVIESAFLCFFADKGDKVDSELHIYGLDDPNPKSFGLADYDLSSRPRTKHTVAWNPEAWIYGKQHQTPDCRAIVQTIVNKEDWQSGNAIGFVIDGDGYRTATAYDGNVHYGPSLKIQFRPATAPSANNLEVADLAPHLE
ncbi:MAG: serine/threonine protein kinase [Aureliella sp.]